MKNALTLKAQILANVARLTAAGDSLSGAYDATDADTIVAVQAAVDAALDGARTTHEAEIGGLKKKNADLVKRLGAARSGDNPDTGEVTRLETELEETAGKLRTAESSLREANRLLKKVEGERDTAARTLDAESAFSRTMLVDNGLTAALIEAKVDPELMDAAKALLGKGVTVKVDGDSRSAVVGDKPLGEFIKEWAASDAAKRFILAPANGGGGAPPSGGGNPGTKKLGDYTEAERLEMARTNPVGWKALLATEPNSEAA